MCSWYAQQCLRDKALKADRAIKNLRRIAAYRHVLLRGCERHSATHYPLTQAQKLAAKRHAKAYAKQPMWLFCTGRLWPLGTRNVAQSKVPQPRSAPAGPVVRKPDGAASTSAAVPSSEPAKSSSTSAQPHTPNRAATGMGPGDHVAGGLSDKGARAALAGLRAGAQQAAKRPRCDLGATALGLPLGTSVSQPLLGDRSKTVEPDVQLHKRHKD